MKKLLIAGCIISAIPIVFFVVLVILESTVKERDWYLAGKYNSFYGRYSAYVYTAASETDATLTDVKIICMDNIMRDKNIIKRTGYSSPKFLYESNYLDEASITITHKTAEEVIFLDWDEIF